MQNYATVQQNTNQPRQKWMRWVFILLAVIIGAYFFLPKRTITVVGVGSESISANKAQITFVYSASGTTRNQALATGEQGFNTLLDTVTGAGATEIKRVAYQIQPVVDGNNAGIGYQYVSGATMKVENTDAINSIMGILTSNNIQATSINYLPDNEDQAKARVQQAALENAKKQAHDIARASGGILGRVLAVAQQSSNADSGTSVTSVNKGTDDINTAEVDVQSVVTVTYEMW